MEILYRGKSMVSRRDFLAIAGCARVLLAGNPVVAQPQPEETQEQHEFVQTMSGFEKTISGAVFHCVTSRQKNVDFTLTVCTPEILRMRMCPEPELKNVRGLLEIKDDWAPSSFTVTEKSESVSVDTGSLRVEFQRNPWSYSIYDKQGRIVLQEHVNDVDTQGNYRGLPIGFTNVGGTFHRCNETFALREEEAFYGLGERFTKLNKVGLRVNGWIANAWGAGTDDAHKAIPFLMSTGGYGIFVNTTFRNRWDIGSRSVVSYTFLIDDPRLDYFFIYGPNLKQVLARYEEITGWPAFPPKKSFGIWFVTDSRSKTGETSPLGIAKKFRELGFPLDLFSPLVAAEDSHPEDGIGQIRQMSDDLGKLGITIGIHSSPFLTADSEAGHEAKGRGYVLIRKDGSPYEANLLGSDHTRMRNEESLEAVERDDAWRARFYGTTRRPAVFLDFTNPAAAKWWKDRVASYMKAGCFGVTMSDFGEDTPADAYYSNGRTGLEMPQPILASVSEGHVRGRC